MVKIVFIGNGFYNRLNVLQQLDGCVVHVINGIDEKDILNKLPKGVIDLFIIDKTKNLFKNIINIINTNPTINHIPIISLITKSDLQHDEIHGGDLFVSEFVTDIEFKYYIKAMIKMKLMDDELKKEKILLELKIKERTQGILKSEAKYKRIYDNVPDIIFTHDLDGIFLTINKNIEMLGYSIDEIIGNHISSFLDEENLNIAYDYLYNKLLKNKTSTKFNIVVLNKNKEKRILEIKSHLIEDVKGEKEVFAIARDVTDNINAQEELKKAKEKAEESDKIKSIFISNMSHEIRTPMNSIIGFSSLLLNEDNPKKIKNYIDIIINSGELLITLIDDIMDLSKMESGNLNIKKSVFDLNKILKDTKQQFKLVLKKRNKNNINIYTGIKQNFNFFTDYERLNQVFNNLLMNAIKFTNDGYIKYDYNIKDGYVEFYVEDTGIGIKEEKIEKVFDRFYQIDRQKNKKQEGTGLGLTISKAIIELLGGNIWIKSKYGSGTTVYFTLPIEKPNIEENINEKEPLLVKKCNGKKVLIVEDNDINYELLEIILLSDKMNIDRVCNIDEFFDKIRIIEYDLILLDLQIPGSEGFELLKWLSINKKDTPVIIQTALASTENEVKALNYGAKGFFTKPINAKELLKKIKIICNNPH